MALLFPPVVDPRGPHLAIPSLAAHLRASGVRTTVRDLNVEGLWALTEPEALEDRVDERTAAAVARARSVLRDPEAFYDPDQLAAARAALAAACTAWSDPAGRVRYQAMGAAYDVDGCDPTRLADLIAVTADRSTNLFDGLWRSELLPALAENRPDVIGISILNRQQIIPGLHLARMLHEAGHVVAIGGTVFAKFAPELMRRPAFFSTFCRAVVPYEGEHALLELVRSVSAGGTGEGVANTLVLGPSGAVVAGPTMVEEVPHLPTPDFDGLPLDRYLAPHLVLPILTGKGCYFNRCKFCDIPAINRISPRAYRMRPADQVAADVVALHRRHGARHFEITDETLSPAFLRKLGRALAEIDGGPEVRARFVGYARFEPGFTPEACAELYAMGVRKLYFGLESGSQVMLDRMDKGIRLPVVRTVLRNCVEAGIAVHLFSIIGFPEETEELAAETVGFLLEESDTLADPRNTFDVHPFGLDLRTDYADQADEFGVDIDRVVLRTQDFPISVSRWVNRRGMDPAQVADVLDRAVGSLRERYRSSGRNFPDQQFPGFEEYAVLYLDRYEDVPFLHRLSLPEPDDPQRYSIEWAEDIELSSEGADAWSVQTRFGSCSVGADELRALAPSRPGQPVAGHRAAWADSGVAMATVDGLIAIRALLLRPA